MIDVRCSCGAVYHAHEDFIGKSLQCTNPACRKILRIERPESKPSNLLNEPVVTSPGSPPGRVRRNRRTGIAIAVVGAIALFGWLLLRTPNTEPPQAPTLPPAPTSEAKPEAAPTAKSDLDSALIPPFKMPTQIAKTPHTTAPQHAPKLILPPCAVGQTPERPETGYRIADDEGTSGESTLEITNGRSVDAVVRLVNVATSRTSRLVYVRGKDAYTIDGIEPNTYSLIFAAGTDWVSACADFERDEDIQEFLKPLIFEETEEDRTRYKVTLHTVLHGNARTKKVDRKRFLEGDQHFSLAAHAP